MICTPDGPWLDDVEFVTLGTAMDDPVMCPALHPKPLKRRRAKRKKPPAPKP